MEEVYPKPQATALSTAGRLLNDLQLKWALNRGCVRRGDGRWGWRGKELWRTAGCEVKGLGCQRRRHSCSGRAR